MNAVTSIRKTPLAGALIMGSVLLFAGTACQKANDEASTASNTPPAASTSATASNASTPATTTGDSADATSSETAGTTGSSAADMSGASQTGSDAATTTNANASGSDDISALTSGPVSDTQFYTAAMTGDQDEIATSKLVANQTSDADVKKLANRIASDHQALDAQVKSAAGAKAMPPAAPDTAAVDPSVQGKSGKDLDRAYVQAMVADHQKHIPIFENVTKNGSTPQARKLASQALPKLRDHLKMAQALQKRF